MPSQGYAEAAEVLDTRQDPFEEAEKLKNELPDSCRVIQHLDSHEVSIEHETDYEPFWISVARFTDNNASGEWADELAESLDSDYRAIFDYTTGEYYIEAMVTE